MSRAQVRDFLADRRELVIGEEGDPDPLSIVYRPGMLSPEFFREVNKLQKREDNAHAAGVFYIKTVVSEWDLKGPVYAEKPRFDKRGDPITDDYGIPETDRMEIVAPGKVIPIESAVIRYLSTALLVYIMNAINEDTAPDPKASTTS